MLLSVQLRNFLSLPKLRTRALSGVGWRDDPDPECCQGLGLRNAASGPRRHESSTRA